MDADHSGSLDPEEMFLLPFPEFHPDENKYAELLAEDMYNSPYMTKEASGGVSLQNYISSVVKADLAGKNCKDPSVTCTDNEQSRFAHLETEAKQHMHEVV